jgi:hypothetical protein
MTSTDPDPDLQGLRELQAQLAGVSASPWQPRCIADAFRTPEEEQRFVFTMQTWIDLDAARSPFLLGSLPSPDLEWEEVMEEYRNAFAAFGCTEERLEKCEPEDLILIGQSMIRTIDRGFALRLRMNPPKGFESTAGDDGFGDWLPAMACLKSQMHFLWSEALAMSVEQALAVINAHRRNEGWTPAETPYALRGEAEIEGQ